MFKLYVVVEDPKNVVKTLTFDTENEEDVSELFNVFEQLIKKVERSYEEIGEDFDPSDYNSDDHYFSLPQVSRIENTPKHGFRIRAAGEPLLDSDAIEPSDIVIKDPDELKKLELASDSSVFISTKSYVKLLTEVFGDSSLAEKLAIAGSYAEFHWALDFKDAEEVIDSAEIRNQKAKSLFLFLIKKDSGAVVRAYVVNNLSLFTPEPTIKTFETEVLQKELAESLFYAAVNQARFEKTDSLDQLAQSLIERVQETSNKLRKLSKSDPLLLKGALLNLKEELDIREISDFRLLFELVEKSLLDAQEAKAKAFKYEEIESFLNEWLGRYKLKTVEASESKGLKIFSEKKKSEAEIFVLRRDAPQFESLEWIYERARKEKELSDVVTVVVHFPQKREDVLVYRDPESKKLFEARASYGYSESEKKYLGLNLNERVIENFIKNGYFFIHSDNDGIHRISLYEFVRDVALTEPKSVISAKKKLFTAYTSDLDSVILKSRFFVFGKSKKFAYDVKDKKVVLVSEIKEKTDENSVVKQLEEMKSNRSQKSKKKSKSR